MAFVVSGKTYTPAPEGVKPAVCVDVADLGQEETEWGNKHKCRIVFEIPDTMEDGRRFTIGKKFTVSLHEKSTLYAFLKQWRGKAFTADELRGFDLEKLIGAPAQVVITHEEKDGSVYANITAIMKAGAERLQPSGSYVRFKDREHKQAGPPTPKAGPVTEDDNIPF